MKLLKSIITASLFICILTISCISPTNLTVSDRAAALALIPEPNSIHINEGNFLLTKATQVTIEPEASTPNSLEDLRILEGYIRSDLTKATGFNLNGEKTSINLSLNTNISQSKEAYILSVTPTIINIIGASPAGLFYGYQTLKQLMPPVIYANQHPSTLKNKRKSYEIPCVEIVDQPRFSWRGFMLDPARNFLTVEEIKFFIDSMVIHKLNVLHLHLTDDQGWRVEIKKYPKLTEVGAFRSETKKSHEANPFFGYDGRPHGGFYTHEDVKEIVAYAAERFITVVPEIDMPGHAQAAIAAYPELGNNPNRQYEVRKTWGVNDVIYNAEDSTIEFFKDVLDEVIEIFPSTYIHVGGDECIKDEWEKSPRIQERIKELGLKDEHHLQSWFITQMDNHLTSKGRKLIGWDEILEGGLTKGATVMAWRGEEFGILSAQMEHDVVMSPTTHTYLDYYSASPLIEPQGIHQLLTVYKAYSWDPCPVSIPAQYKKYIIGGQGNIWGEYVRDIEHAMYMTYPRGCATAESLWSLNENKNYFRFDYKLDKHLFRLAHAGIQFRYDLSTITDAEFITFDGEIEMVEIDLPLSDNGFYQLYIRNTIGDEIEISKVELLINDEIVDAHTRRGTSNIGYNQGSIYYLRACPDTIATQGGTARIYATTAKNRRSTSRVLIKTL